ncbi:hypothetical protein TVAG_294050 [Trichomonas vaginalis G3]|uniref:RPGR-interacting protein 1 first C2 domain-containing protein n=1 Tax=Trichomonas vaginalis (strain ATCC PRA-98 / G3) TaxID=412133 RepID=A2G2C0_TRIV3|nr:retinitis pigmentosa GTPase regulator-interacting protein family [Trichomonas vaginalis G3]EAX88699.1 hypothetical protein TVAG_294050 [Trichomonas vaginalis G3]KAI5519891.1 retinitis pigmentosa GTPase regulator-interacting protein family [Trichomonas vaginalis G3]|eukprot:XP_001301629.1 hypothetical protein [Trichomonas vaginalis G3]
MLSPKARTAGELSLDDLKEEFLKNCESLERKAKALVTAKSEIGPDDQVKELQLKIKQLEAELARKQRRRNNLLRQVRSFKALTGATATRVKQPVAANFKGSSARSKSRTDVIKQLNDYNSKHHDPNIDFALLVLHGKATPEELNDQMDADKEQIGFGEVIQRRMNLNKYRQQSDQLTADLDTLRKQYEKLEMHRDDVVHGYQSQADQNTQAQREYNDYYKKLEQKKQELQKAQDLESQNAQLQSEIDASGLDNEARIERLNKAKEQAAKDQLKREIADLQNDSARLEESNANLEQKIHELEATSPKKSSKEEEITAELDKLKEQLNEDPSTNMKFNNFIAQMESYALSPQDVVDKNKEKTELEQQIRDIQQEIEELQNKDQQLQHESDIKRENISKLENSLTDIANEYEKLPTDQVHAMPEFIKGAPSIKFTKQDIFQIGQDQTAIIIYFKTFSFEHSFIGKKPSKVFLNVELLEHQSTESQPVDITSGVFNSRMIFVCKNDFFLAEYLERTSASVIICRQREDMLTEAARTEVNMLPFLDGNKEMTQTVPLWNTQNKQVGKLTFEAAIYRAPIKSKNVSSV